MKNKIIIESQFLFDYNYPEKGITVGGSQRYALELGNLIEKLGYEVIFITKSNSNFEGHYEGFGRVISFNSKYGNLGNRNFSRRVYEYASKVNASLVIYSDLLVSSKWCFSNSIGIQHGIAWDNPNFNKIKKWINKKLYIKATLKHKKVICVDTNFINWMRLESEKYFNNPDRLIYIPNFADDEKFMYVSNDYNDNVFKLLYPRRLVKHRGFDIFTKMCLELVEEGFNIMPIYAIEETNHDILYKKYPNLKNIKHKIYNPDFDSISKLYNESYITYVPTIWSEGTSLSAIESIMAGCPIIVSDVGGLGNIVINDFNGYIVSPTVEQFKNKTIEIIKDKEKRKRLKQNCLMMRNSFSLKRWRKEVTKILEEVLEKSN